MELWIRSQNKIGITKVNNIQIEEHGYSFIRSYDYDGSSTKLGIYKTKERALEVLDEIQSKLKQQYIVRPNGLTSREEKDEEAARLNYCYNGDFIMENEMFKIEPINAGIVVYEMPEE